MTQSAIRPVNLAVATAVVVLALAACGPKSPSEQGTGAASPAADAAQNDAKAQELAAREQELAQREAAIKEQEEAAAKQKALEEELARRDAENAAAAEKAKAEQAAAAKAATAKKNTATKTAAAGAAGATAAKAAEPPKPIVVPAGTPLAISLGTAVSTKTAKVGDRVNGQLASDVVIDGRKAASAGAAISGSVYKVISGSDRVGTTPKLTIIFDSLVASNGATVPIAAKFQQLGQSEKGKDTAKIVGAAAAGAIIGNQVSHKGGSVIGGVIGAGAGTAIANKTGNEVEVAAGTAITASTTAEFQVKAK